LAIHVLYSAKLVAQCMEVSSFVGGGVEGVRT
jgi:hypothetical protein